MVVVVSPSRVAPGRSSKLRQEVVVSPVVVLGVFRSRVASGQSSHP